MVYKIIMICFFLVSMASCSTFDVASLSGNGATVLTTGKTPSDWVISFVMEKDCVLFRMVVRKEICQ